MITTLENLDAKSLMAVLADSGYTGTISQAEFVRFTSGGDAVYSISYPDPDENTGIDHGYVFVRETENGLRAEF